jgi:hypothetical protein
VSKLGDTIPAIFMKWLPASGHEPIRNSGFFERYGEGFNVESGRGDIEIWIPIHWCPVPEIGISFVAIKIGRRQGARRAHI